MLPSTDQLIRVLLMLLIALASLFVVFSVLGLIERVQ